MGLFSNIETHRPPPQDDEEAAHERQVLVDKTFKCAIDRKITTKDIFDIVEVLKIKKLSMLDFSCSVPLDTFEPEPARFIAYPSNVGVGRTRKRKSNRKNSRKKRRKSPN